MIPTGPDDDWTHLTSLPSRYGADLLVGRLKEAGIRVRVERGRNDPAAWLTSYGGSAGPFDLYVPGEKGEAAQKLLIGISASRNAGDDRSLYPLIQVVGRALILVAILALIATFLLQVLR